LRARQRIEQHQALDLIVRERDAQRGLGILGGNTSRTSPRTRKVPRLNSSSFLSYCIAARRAMMSRLGHPLFFAHVQDHAVVIDGVADAVDAGHGRDDHGVFAFEQRLRRRQAHLLDVLVDARVLLDIEVARRNVGLGW